MVLMAVFFLQVSVTAQAPALEGEMKKLEFLVGEWKGEGSETFPGRKYKNSFTQKTKIEITKDSLLRIKDERNYKPKGGALHTGSLEAIISYDTKLKLYSWRGKNSKITLEAKLIGERTFQFGMPFSAIIQPKEGNRKTTIRVTENGEWHETIEEFLDGEWFVMEESTLKRIK